VTVTSRGRALATSVQDSLAGAITARRHATEPAWLAREQVDVLSSTGVSMQSLCRVGLVIVAAMLLGESATGAQTVPRDKLLVVVNRAPATVSIFKVEGASLSLLKNVPIGREAREVCLSPDGRRAYVSNSGDNTITVIDLGTLAAVATIADPSIMKPDGATVSPDGKKLYVVGMNNNSVVVISTTTNKVLSRIPVPCRTPRRVVFSPDGTRIYLGCYEPSIVGIIDPKTDTFVRAFPVGNDTRGKGEHALAFTPDGKILLVAVVEDDTLYYVDVATEKVTRIQGVGLSPQRLIVKSDGTTLVLARMDGSVMVIGDLFKHDKTKRVPVGALPWGMALSDDGRFLYVPSNSDNNITVIDTATATVAKTIPVESDPNGVAFRK
jgi:YVTN family beta-propeller protein